MIRMFQILAAALIAVAAFFLWRADYDTAFVTAVIGICAFFLSMRFTFKSRVQEREELRSLEADSEDEAVKTPDNSKD